MYFLALADVGHPQMAIFRKLATHDLENWQPGILKIGNPGFRKWQLWLELHRNKPDYNGDYNAQPG